MRADRGRAGCVWIFYASAGSQGKRDAANSDYNAPINLRYKVSTFSPESFAAGVSEGIPSAATFL